MDLTQLAPIPTGNGTGFEIIGSGTLLQALPPGPMVVSAPGFSNTQSPGEPLVLSPAEVVLSFAVPHDEGTPVISGTACQGLGCQDAAILTFDSGLKFIDCSGGSGECFFDRNLASTTQVQSVPGVIEWGRWIGGPILASDSNLDNQVFGTNKGGFHYIVGVPASEIPVTDGARFRFIGATTPTFSDGIGGNLGSGTMTGGEAFVNWNTGRIGGKMDLTFNGTAISNYLLRMTDVRFEQGKPGVAGNGLLVLVPGGAVNVCQAADCSVNFAGFFAGPKASHLGLGYNVAAEASATSSTSPSAFTINGVVVMGR